LCRLFRKEAVLATDSDNGSIVYSKVEISGTNIRKIDGGRIVLTIQKEQIRQVRLCYDTKARNPFCQYFLGFTLFSLGLLGLVVAFLASAGRGGILKAEPGEFVVPLIPIIFWIMTGTGFWLLLGIFRARYHLCIDTDNGVRRIFFGKAAEVTEIRQFIRLANQKFGYEIDISILEKMHRSS
jgi:hypothetical protein